MERGDIYLVSLDPTAGHEQQGTRPVLVVSPAAFNRLTKTPVVLPITTGGNFARTAGFAVPLADGGDENHGRDPLRPAPRPRSGRPQRAQAGKRARRHRGRGSGEAGAAL